MLLFTLLVKEFNVYHTRLGGSTSRKGKVAVAGDFNAKSAELFTSHTDRKGVLLLEFATANRLVL